VTGHPQYHGDLLFRCVRPRCRGNKTDAGEAVGVHRVEFRDRSDFRGESKNFERNPLEVPIS
jgi:hypothetical protein